MKRKIRFVTVTLFSLAALISCASSSERKPQLTGATITLEEAMALEDPEDIMAWVDVPKISRLGETVSLEIVVENGRDKEEFNLSGFDILDEFLEGFHILDINPEPREKDHSFGSLSLAYSKNLKPGETFRIELRLKAKRTGVFIGDVDVNEGDDFLTRYAQIRVK